MKGVHQFVPMLHVGDAVGKHAAGLQHALRARGVRSEIYVELDDPDTVDRTRPARSYPGEAEAGDVLVYQFATASDLAGWLVGRPEPLIVNYHNVTPPELFAPWDNGLARHQVRAMAELSALAPRAALGVAVSELNRRDLRQRGFAATAVVPPIVDLRAVESTDGAAGGGQPRRRGARWLSVGRLAPNKAVEDTIAALLAYRRRHDAEASLLVVGGTPVPAYAEALEQYAAELGLADAVRFAGKVDDDALGDAYRTSDVLVVASEHEGFCLPVVEAMAQGLPVVACRRGALPEVLGDAGVLLENKDPVVTADAVHRLQTDDEWRAAVVGAGHRRLPALGLDDAAPRLAGLLLAVREGDPWPSGVDAGPDGAGRSGPDGLGHQLHEPRRGPLDREAVRPPGG
ncbi:MAG TPA: glycosyltransferase family 4 protein [Acidimicrobiales bacterium]|nr:glycosyltransferase family 4 protein [Acidimicrobiales bacterium]